MAALAVLGVVLDGPLGPGTLIGVPSAAGLGWLAHALRARDDATFRRSVALLERTLHDYARDAVRAARRREPSSGGR